MGTHLSLFKDARACAVKSPAGGCDGRPAPKPSAPHHGTTISTVAQNSRKPDYASTMLNETREDGRQSVCQVMKKCSARSHAPVSPSCENSDETVSLTIIATTGLSTRFCTKSWLAV